MLYLVYYFMYGNLIPSAIIRSLFKQCYEYFWYWCFNLYLFFLILNIFLFQVFYSSIILKWCACNSCFYISLLGPEPGVFKSKHYCLRLHYSVYGQSGYFHMFRSTNTRFFNNMAVPIKSEEEAAGNILNLRNIFFSKLD